jgi:transcriptional regulator with XRE-family HTH domain
VNYFSKNIKYLIRKFDTNQSDIASYVGKTQTSVSNWINGISEPDISILIKIREFFGISMDALVLMDLENGKIIPDSHVQNFKLNRKVSVLNHGKVDHISSSYFIDEKGSLTEPTSTEMWAVMGQLKELHKKIDNLQLSLGKSKKQG